VSDHLSVLVPIWRIQFPV